jgi:hypothetical protein
MSTFKHTDKTAEVFNNMLHDYQKIDSDSEVEKRKLSYDTYKNMGFIIDCLRYDGKTTIDDKSLAEYFQSFGFTVSLNDNIYTISL